MSDEGLSLAGTLALLASTVAVLFAVALAVDGAKRSDAGIEAGLADDAEPLTALDSRELLELSIERAPVVARRVAEIRDLEFREVPEPQVTDVAALRELAEEEIAKPKVGDVLAAGDAELKLLGLLEPDASLADVVTEVTAGAAAYYDPKEQELFLLGDAVPAGPALAEFVLAHELDHALEDQAFGLPRSIASNDDRVLAESALVEGSATAVMTDYAAEHLALTDLLSDSAALTSDTSGLPPIAVAQVTFTYFAGQRFVDDLREAAGNRWDLVDFAYEARLPESTEQILHPEKYLADERPLPVAGPRPPGPGWEEADAGAIGEFVTREILRQDAERLGADEAAEGWGGDHYRLFRRVGVSECSDDCRSDHALAIAWRGDDAGEAVELRDALEEFVERSLGAEATAVGSFELEGGWAAVSGKRDVATIAFAPDETLALRLARPVLAQPE